MAVWLRLLAIVDTCLCGPRTLCITFPTLDFDTLRIEILFNIFQGNTSGDAFCQRKVQQVGCFKGYIILGAGFTKLIGLFHNLCSEKVWVVEKSRRIRSFRSRRFPTLECLLQSSKTLIRTKTRRRASMTESSSHLVHNKL